MDVTLLFLRLMMGLGIAAHGSQKLFGWFADLVPMWAGQSANRSTRFDVTALLTALVDEVSEIAGPVMRWSAGHSRRSAIETRQPVAQ